MYDWKYLPGTVDILAADWAMQQEERARIGGWAEWMLEFGGEWLSTSIIFHIWNAPLRNLFQRKMDEAVRSMNRLLEQELFKETS